MRRKEVWIIVSNKKDHTDIKNEDPLQKLEGSAEKDTDPAGRVSA